MTASVMVLVALTVVVAALAAYRWFITRNEDDTLHIADPTGLVISTQQHMAHTLKKIDDVGIGLTVATAVYGVALFALSVYAGLK